MMIEQTLFGTEDNVQTAINRLQDNEPDGGYILAFSGGKDSCVIKELALMAGVEFTPVYNVTTIDHPALCAFIRRFHPDVEWHRPEQTFFKMMEKKGLPTRNRRWCCEKLKEHAPPESTVITGVRRAESTKRKNRKVVWTCHKKNEAQVRPIVDWTEKEVWQFIRERNIPYCELYDKGYKRLGCIGCPMSVNRERDFVAYPRFETLWKKAANIYYQRAIEREAKWTSVLPSFEDFWRWWLSNKPMPKINQLRLFI